jgi:hypothetical protein
MGFLSGLFCLRDFHVRRGLEEAFPIASRVRRSAVEAPPSDQLHRCISDDAKVDPADQR